MSTATVTANEPGIWEMEVAESSGGDFTPCPAGNYPATIVGLFDIGHQPETRKDQKTGAVSEVEVRKLVLVYELSKKAPDGRPFVMGDRVTWSMRDNSNFFKLVTNVLGERFNPGQKFTPTRLLGKAVMVNVTNTEKDDKGKFFANVGNVSSFPEGFPEPTPAHASILWSVLDGTPFPTSAGPWLPFIFGKTISALAAESAEAREAGRSKPSPVASALAPGSGEAKDDDIPF